MKSTLKQAVVTAGRAVSRWRQTPRVVVLCYHAVDPAHPIGAPTSARFGEHLGWLKAHADVIPFADVCEAARTPRDRPAVAITFDDGYADNATHALPLLSDHGATATFFLTTGFLDHTPGVEPKMRANWGTDVPLVPMTWAQARALYDAGMTLGAHTHTHPNLARATAAATRDELARSKTIIEDHIGAAVTTFAYPFGKPRRHFTDATRAIAEEVGFRHAAAVAFRGVQPGDDPLAVPRFFVTNDTVAELADKVLGAWDIIGHVQDRMPLALARRLSPLDFTFE